MIYHSIILNFGLSLPDDELQELLKNSYPEASHPSRIAGFYSSRNSLLSNLRKIYPQASFKNLMISDYRELTDYPDVVLSLSHSPLAGASVVALKKDYLSLGIDIESIQREVKESIIQRVTTESDLKLPSRETWCLKEAIYKCVSNSGLVEGTLEFKDMVIQDKKWLHSPSQLSGEWRLFSELDHQVAIATLKNQNS